MRLSRRFLFAIAVLALFHLYIGLRLLPSLALGSTGLVVGWLRARTDSVYPGMALHATFNAIALIASVAGS